MSTGKFDDECAIFASHLISHFTQQDLAFKEVMEARQKLAQENA